MIEVKQLNFNYNDNNDVIKNIDLKMETHQKISIIGRSGCGKTTLLLILAGILDKYQGLIKINNESLNGYRRKTGIIFQNGGLFPWKTVYGNLVLGLKARKIDQRLIDEKVDQVLEELEILDVKHKYIKDLSGGQKQRVAIARTLILDSDLLLFDEPSASLDAMTKDNFQNLLLNVYDKYPLCSIVVTHDIEEAVFLGQKVLIMKDGKIDEIIDNEKLFGNKKAKETLEFYETCIEIRKRLE